MKQNGVYISSFENNNFDYHPKVLDYDDEKEYKENGYRDSGRKSGRDSERESGRDRRKELRRAASEYNVSELQEDEGFGFSVRGDAPVVIASVEPNSLADVSIRPLVHFLNKFFNVHCDEHSLGEK